MATETITCYRHPDRRAGVKCQRCERWICPSCMHQASVGFHCPECLAARPQKVYRAAQLRAFTPYVTYALIALNAMVFFVGFGENGSATVDGQLLGVETNQLGNIVGGVAHGEWYRLITSGFLHVNLVHIGMNMLFLFLLGPLLERELGRINFILLYFAALLAGSLGVMLLDPFVPTVGASGALYGLLGGAVALQLSKGINPWSSGIGGLILINLLITFAIPGISIGGHLGGLVGGLLAGFGITWIDERLGSEGPARLAAPAFCVALMAVFFLTSLWAADYAAIHASAVISL